MQTASRFFWTTDWSSGPSDLETPFPHSRRFCKDEGRHWREEFENIILVFFVDRSIIAGKGIANDSTQYFFCSC